MFPSRRLAVSSKRMLRKLLWSGLYAGLASGAAVVARTVASKLWRISTGEEPPSKR